MYWTNPYIEKVENHPNILVDETKIFSHAGNWKIYFWNNVPLVLEIGTGMGNFFGKLVWENVEKNFLWLELRYKRLLSTAEKAIHANLKNKREKYNFIVLKTPGQTIDQIFTQSELSETYIFFPDPWATKERQKKNRLVGYDFLKKLSFITKIWGKFYFKTDHREYFESVLSLLKDFPEWKENICSFDYEQEEELFDTKNITEFESYYRGQNLKIHYLEWERI